jgi:hypothetical protein
MDNLVWRACVIKRATFLASKLFSVTVQPWGERIPVGKDNLLLRECVIKNTDFVEGLVVYAGHESKVNSSTMFTNKWKNMKLQWHKHIQYLTPFTNV